MAKKDDQDQQDPSVGIDEAAGDGDTPPEQADPSLASRVGADQVAESFDDAHEKGYRGQVPPGPPNEAYSLESGPDSPSALEAVIAQREADVEAVKASASGGAGDSS